MKVIRMNVNMVLPENFVWSFPQGRNDHLFVIFKSPAIITLNGKDIPVNSGDTVLFDKFDPQKYYPTEGCFVHDFIHFDFDNEYEKTEFADYPYSSVIYASNHTELSELLSIIQRHLLLDSPFDKHVVKSLGDIFLMLLKNNASVRKNATYERLIALRAEIHNNPQLPWTIDLMAQKLAISTSALQSSYKEAFGTTCIADVITARIEAAKRLLTDSELSVNQISELCGYQSYEHFIRQFKSKEGVTPLVFRKNQTR